MDFKKIGRDSFEYEDENGVYTFVDMGDYLSSNRSPFDSPKVFWVLSYYRSKDEKIRIEGDVEKPLGEYQRILINGTVPVFLVNGIPQGKLTPEIQNLVDWFINMNKNLKPKLIEYIQENKDNANLKG